MKGQTVEKLYTKSIPTVVVWDASYEDGKPSLPEDEEREGDQVWEDMEYAEDNDDNDGRREGHTDDEPSTNRLQKKSRTK